MPAESITHAGVIKERTESEWRALLRSAGLQLTCKVHPEPRRGASLVEAVRATPA